MNNDYFYEDNEQIYNLKYTHKELVALLEKLEKGRLLTEEHYKQLIEEIGLDNISTFDLNYFNLKNLPPIPVRVSELFNDAGYDYKARVDLELEALEELIVNEIERIDLVLEDLTAMNIEDTLSKIETAEERLSTLNKDIYNLNGVIFSFERSIELMEDTTNEVKLEFEALKNMQESDELRLYTIEEIMKVHTDDIQSLLKQLEAERENLTKTKEELEQVKKVSELLYDYRNVVHEVDLRLTEMELIIKSMDPDNLDLEAILKVTSDINDLKNKNNELEIQFNSMVQQVNDFKTNTDINFNSINNIVLELKNNISLIENNIELNKSQLLSHENNLLSINDNIKDITNTLNVHNSNIEILIQRDEELLLEINNIKQDLESLIEESESHYEILETINNDISNLKTNVIDLNNSSAQNAENIINIQNNLDALEALHTIIDNRVQSLENNVVGNSDKIISINNELTAVNNTFTEMNKEIDRIDANILSLSTNFEIHNEQNQSRIQEVDEIVETLNQKVSAAEANVLTFQSRVTEVENTLETLATKELVNSINLQMHINEQGFVVVELIILNDIVSSIVIPYNVKFEEQIAKTDSARTDYSKTI